ncbi:MAG: nitronate monooxygenase [Micrococcus sp.]|nr:nitronate monooxygenase [Micrococcus sp.]
MDARANMPAILRTPHPVTAAPMAGGPSTPELVAAVVGAGGAAWLAGGMRSVAQIRAQVNAVRALLAAGGAAESGAGAVRVAPDDAAQCFGVNLFVPDVANAALTAGDRERLHSAQLRARLEDYRERLHGDAAAVGVALPEVADILPDDDAEAAAFAAAIDAAVEQGWPAISFTFGLPERAVFARLAAAGIPAGVTVTDAEQARMAVAAGAVFLTVQSAAAGGHQGSLRPLESVREVALVDLLAEVRTAVDVPLVAAGAIATADDVAAVLDAGAVSAQIGTAFLLTREAGTSPAHREALTQARRGAGFVRADVQADVRVGVRAGVAAAGTPATAHPAEPAAHADTALTRAYTGRWARGLRTRFMDEHADAPSAYPHLNALTGGLRRAAAAANDLHRVHLWAGTAAAQTQPERAADVVQALSPDGT